MHHSRAWLDRAWLGRAWLGRDGPGLFIADKKYFLFGISYMTSRKLLTAQSHRLVMHCLQ